MIGFCAAVSPHADPAGLASYFATSILFKVALANASVGNKNGLPPAAVALCSGVSASHSLCLLADLSTRFVKNSFFLATMDKRSVPCNIFCLTSFISPNNSLNALLPLPITVFTGRPSVPMVAYLPLVTACSNLLVNISVLARSAATESFTKFVLILKVGTLKALVTSVSFISFKISLSPCVAFFKIVSTSHSACSLVKGVGGVVP